ncbi:MAG: sodium/solute symporter [Kordiimonadaceae bacterium]|nr:sodium/solute symporter [Kordiimonadaceae bacterium]MBT6134391.1 sodium/solute symporter [Kordiimonadaceae bacterium]MBT6466758.1 sodium/solute symporter [Kordiimonadaceae bacterium]MBT7543839.1 sodium/solute symporter [Kordiimonadaceae bacterium]MBT7605369.1 sodium/solute symporter [Kordiimonadaceae bacterium]
MLLGIIDISIVVAYTIFIIVIAQYVSREKVGHSKNAQDYFLAGKALPWWAIGASLIAANISAEQIIGMSGSGFVIGLGIASYEWMGAITLLIVGRYFLPIFLQNEIYSMPQFLEKRYDGRVRLVMAIFWLGLYIFVNLTSILWLGALAVNAITGIELTYGLIMLGGCAVAYSLYGGLKAVALTDIIQVALLVFGGLMVSAISLNQIGGEQGVWGGFIELTEQLPEKFDMIISPESEHYKDLPGLSVLIGGMWMMNLSYWGFNQYVIQRALAAKNLAEARKGILFACFLKILMPVIVVLPGIAAALIIPDLDAPDQAYPEMMKLLPVGIKGLVFAALIAAILSSLGSMMNSISTIFTMDIYRQIKTNVDDNKLVTIGRVAGLTSMVIAIIIAKPLLGNFSQAFQFIQEFTGFFTPGIVVIFLLGLFWKKATANSALVAGIGSFVFSIILREYWPDFPFIDRVGIVFILCGVLAIAISYIAPEPEINNTIIKSESDRDTVDSAFIIGSIAITIIISSLYITWW